MGAVLAIIGGLVVGVAGTASAGGAYDSIVSNMAHVSCEHMVNDQVGASLPTWKKVLNFLNPFGDVYQPAAGAVFLVLQCAFSPEMVADLQDLPVEVRSIYFQFKWNSGGFGLVGCATTGWGGSDWFPLLDGSETRIGCKVVAYTTYTPMSTWKSETNNFQCLQGIQINTSRGVIRSYTAGSSAGGVVVSGPTYRTNSSSVCQSTGGYNLGGVIPPNWDPGSQPWADLGGCKGLTIKSGTDLRTGSTSPGQEVPMALAAVDPDRSPGAVDVIIQPHEARPAGEAYRWVGYARWPTAPTFTFVVGPEPYTMVTQWVFTITCSDGTSKTLWYDPSGAGGNPDYSAVHPGFDWEACIAEAAEPGLDPDTWIPALVERIRCLVIWAVTPTYGISWHAARFSQAMDDTALGDVRQVATAPARVLGSMQGAAGTTSTITTGWGVVNLPAVDPGIASKIRLGLSVLIGLWAIRLTVRWLTAATNMRVGDDEHAS